MGQLEFFREGLGEEAGTERHNNEMIKTLNKSSILFGGAEEEARYFSTY